MTTIERVDHALNAMLHAAFGDPALRPTLDQRRHDLELAIVTARAAGCTDVELGVALRTTTDAAARWADFIETKR